MRLQTITRQDYEAFLATRKDEDFLQSTFAADKFEADGWSIEYVQAKEGDTIKATAMICKYHLLRFFQYAYIPRGFFIDYQNQADLSAFTQLLKKHLKKQKVIYLEIDPAILYRERDINGQLVPEGINNQAVIDHLLQAGYLQMPLTQGYDTSKQCRWMSVIDLRNKSKDDIFSAFSTMQKRNIRTAEKSCVKTRVLRPDELNILDAMEQESGQRQQFEAMPLSYFQSMYTYYGPEHVKTVYAYLDLPAYEKSIANDLERVQNEIQDLEAFLQESPQVKKKITRLKTARKEKEALCKKELQIQELKQNYTTEVPLSCCMFMKYKNQVTFLFGGNDYNYRAYRGSYAVQWYMIQEAIREGYDFFNLYGISGYFEKGQEGYGVFDFKRGFHAQVVELIGRYHLVIHPILYRLHKQLHKNI